MSITKDRIAVVSLALAAVAFGFDVFTESVNLRQLLGLDVIIGTKTEFVCALTPDTHRGGETWSITYGHLEK